MQSNNSNNEQNWIQRLDDFETAPSINLDASWEKLQMKFPAKKNKSKKIIYWLAVASVILVAVLTISIQQGKKIEPVEPVIVKAGLVKTTIENKGVVFENTKPATGEIYIVKKGVEPVKQEVSPVLKSQLIQKEMPVLSLQPEEIEQKLLVDSITKPVIALKAPAKKLKLVHINEIGGNAAGKELVQQEGKPYFPVTYPTKQVYTNNSNNNQAGKDHLIRIKLN